MMRRADDVFYIEGVRVAEGARGQGFGVQVGKEAMNAIVADTDSTLTIRFLLATDFDNFAMRRIFERTGWACRGCFEIWPSSKPFQPVSEQGEDAGSRYLDLLGISSSLPPTAMPAVSSRKQEGK